MPDIAILYQTNSATPMVITERHLNMIREHNSNGDVRVFSTEKELIDSGFDAEVLVAWGRLHPNDYCNSCSNLSWIQAISAGIEGLTSLDAAKRGVPVTKISGVHGIPMAQTTLCYILSFLRGMPQIYANQRKHIWQKPSAPEPEETIEKTVAIVGMGDIGSRVAALCKMLGMKVIGCKRHVTQMENVDEMYSTNELEKVLNLADFVVCLVPHTPQSEKMFGAKEFASMKRTGVFINIGRGAVVDTDALTEALKKGIIAGAALDAVDPEPLPKDSPLWDMENVIITPHCAADSPYYFDRIIPIVCENLDRYQDGRELLYK